MPTHWAFTDEVEVLLHIFSKSAYLWNIHMFCYIYYNYVGSTTTHTLCIGYRIKCIKCSRLNMLPDYRSDHNCILFVIITSMIGRYKAYHRVLISWWQCIKYKIWGERSLLWKPYFDLRRTNQFILKEQVPPQVPPPQHTLKKILLCICHYSKINIF